MWRPGVMITQRVTYRLAGWPAGPLRENPAETVESDGIGVLGDPSRPDLGIRPAGQKWTLSGVTFEPVWPDRLQANELQLTFLTVVKNRVLEGPKSGPELPPRRGGHLACTALPW